MFSFIIFGIKNKEEFDWYNQIMKKHKILYQLRCWFAGILVMILHIIFKYAGKDGCNSEYISALLRSFMIVIIFNSVLNKKIKKFEDESQNPPHKKDQK